MTIEPGTRLGPYEIVAPIGAGGMGEVFRARDCRLDRSVAIKILSPDYASNRDFRLRLEREAKTISQLNHPHICTLYDIGEENGTEYLVMELLEGESLAERLSRGPLPLDHVLRYGREIASALADAHRHGVVHRDLKPANIIITKSGAKLLDFGLAKPHGLLFGGATSTLATEYKPLTAEGTIIGTLQYMAPEQIDGLEAHHRTDIFGLGAVLYEMMTGRPAFQGKTRTSLIAAIVSQQPPPISERAPLAPAPFEHLVRKCLEKDPDDRWQSAHDVAAQLEWIASAGAATTAVPPGRVHRREFLFAAGGAALGVAGAGIARFFTTRDSTQAEAEFFSIAAPVGTDLEIGLGAPQLSPDGTKVVWVATDGEARTSLWLRSIASPEAQPLAGTAGARGPFWSPDGRQIGFFTPSDEGKLKRIDLAGGAVVELADAPHSSGGSWSIHDEIVYVGVDAPVRLVPAAGGTPRDVTNRGTNEIERSHTFPSFLPDGRHFLYHAVVLGERPGAILRLGSTDGSTARDLMGSASAARYMAPGYLLYRRDRDLIAHRFDSGRLVAGSEIVKVGNAVTDAGRQVMASASDRGDLLYHTGHVTGQTELVWFDRGGRELQRIGRPARYRRPSISHDGRRIAVELPDAITAVSTVWILDAARDSLTRLTSPAHGALLPAWSPDDQYVCFMHARTSAGDIGIKRVDATEPEQVLESNPAFTIPTDWSPDGKLIVLHERTPDDTTFDVFLFSVHDRKRTLFARNTTSARFSPDGIWLAFTSDGEVYAQRLNGDSRRWQISTDGGGRPRWGRDGKEIFYTSRNRLMAVPVSATGNRLDVGMPHVVLPASINMVSSPHPPYDLAPDGRILVCVDSDQTVDPMTLVRNWPALIKT